MDDQPTMTDSQNGDPRTTINRVIAAIDQPHVIEAGCHVLYERVAEAHEPEWRKPETTMPAVTLWQPWACLIEVGAKPYETRSFPIPRRLLGKRVAIHAAARRCFVAFDQNTIEAIEDAFGQCNWNHWLPRGVIVCTAVLAESIPADRVDADLFGDYTPGRWAWRLEDVRPVIPHVAAKGRQQIGWEWTVPKGVHL